MKRIVAIVISLIVVISSAAQDIEQLTKADPVAWSGGLTWSNIFTWPKDSAKQVPTYSYYISGSLNTTIFGVVSVPISFAYTNNELSSTITYPFNRFSLTPSYKWVKLHIGYSQMTFSTYTMTGHDFLGGGVELMPDEMPWRFSAFFGRLNKAVPRDSINTEPIYKRMGGGVMGGYKGERWSLMANTINYYYMGIGHGTPCLKVTPAGDMTINGSMVAKGDVTAYSDARVKSDVEELSPRGELRPVSYIKDGRRGIGFIAQEVREVYLELVREDEDGMLSLNYDGLVAVLYAEVQELIRALSQIKG